MQPTISIVIPTHNRADLLLRCMRHLESQTTHDFQVVVVDDGSTDHTRVALDRYLPTAPFILQVFHQPNSGPARARNLALSHCSSPLCLFIGDDTFPVPSFVATHLDFHLHHTQQHAAAVGLTRWSHFGQAVTPFMRWIESEGVQFDYRKLLAGIPPTWSHFYTSNLSLKTSLLGPNPFNETFHGYGLEDIELGYRLAKLHRLTLSFLPEAIVEHLHPTTFTQSCHRAVHVGAAEFRFEQLWPETRPSPRPLLKRLLFAVLSERRFILPAFTFVTRLVTRFICPNPLLHRLFQCYRINGYRLAQNAYSASPHPVDHNLAKPVC